MYRQITASMLTLLVAVAAFGSEGPTTQPTIPKAVETHHDDFPNTIAFIQGATQFEAGDRITIMEVCSTSSDLQSGICRISGTYNLASHDKATLAASVTARDSADGYGPWNSAQTTTISKGHGTFTLILPISVRGWPHVSFYGQSSDFGGTYFGTADSVLRRWWGS